MINEFDTPKDRTENFKKHREVMGDISISTIVKVVEFLEHYCMNCDSFDLDEELDSLTDVVKELRTQYPCRHCSRYLYLSDLPQYDYLCVYCDENF